MRTWGDDRATLEDRAGGDLKLILTADTPGTGASRSGAPPNRTNTSGVIMGATGIKCIKWRAEIHTAGSGINPFKEAMDAEVYGSSIYYNGRQTQRAGDAYGSYIQNVDGRKLIRDNIYHHNWSMGIHAYESGGADLDNMPF